MEEAALEGAVSKVLEVLFPFRPKGSGESYTLAEVSEHSCCSDCWVVVGDKVYDVTSFLDKHPGGLDVLLEHAGRDATVAFYGAGHHLSTINLLEPFCIGSLAQHERVDIIRSVSKSRWTTGAVKVVD